MVRWWGVVGDSLTKVQKKKSKEKNPLEEKKGNCFTRLKKKKKKRNELLLHTLRNMTRAPSVETWRAALGPSSANDVIKQQKKKEPDSECIGLAEAHFCACPSFLRGKKTQGRERESVGGFSGGVRLNGTNL
jgi:hypothetical protein